MDQKQVEIRAYGQSDAEQVQSVCLETAGAGLRRFKKFLLGSFCDYYIEAEPGNCFVATDVQDRAVGYILCSEDTKIWKKIFDENYVKRLPPIFRLAARGSGAEAMKFADEYPAHLHIDILPEYQHSGVGTGLMEVLIEHLRQKSVAGVQLTVAKSNVNARAFYQKCGFAILADRPTVVVMGVKL